MSCELLSKVRAAELPVTARFSPRSAPLLHKDATTATLFCRVQGLFETCLQSEAYLFIASLLSDEFAIILDDRDPGSDQHLYGIAGVAWYSCSVQLIGTTEGGLQRQRALLPIRQRAVPDNEKEAVGPDTVSGNSIGLPPDPGIEPVADLTDNALYGLISIEPYGAGDPININGQKAHTR